MFTKFVDKKEVYLLTSAFAHNTASVRVRGRHQRTVEKPNSVIAYNKFMGAVDKSDQLQQPYSAARKAMKWYRKLTVHFLQISMLNAYCIYSVSLPSGQKPKTYLQFQHSVLMSLVSANARPMPSTAMDDSSARLQGKHFVDYLPASGRKEKPTKRCRVCYTQGVRGETRYYCPNCPSGPALCIPKCFELYHTKPDYKNN